MIGRSNLNATTCALVRTSESGQEATRRAWLEARAVGVFAQTRRAAAACDCTVGATMLPFSANFPFEAVRAEARASPLPFCKWPGRH